MFSERLSIHLTGRCRRLASSTARISSAKTFSFAPKPPPTSDATTRSLSSGHPAAERQHEAADVRDLGGGVERHVLAARLGHAPARLDRRSRGAVVGHAPLDDLVGVRKGGIEIPARDCPFVCLVRAELVPDERRALFKRRLRVDHRRQRLVLDDHVLDGVVDAVAVGADHDRDRVADVLDGVLGKRPVLRGLDLHARRAPRSSASEPRSRRPGRRGCRRRRRRGAPPPPTCRSTRCARGPRASAPARPRACPSACGRR